MLLTVPTDYKAIYVPPRKRSTDTAIMRTAVEVSIREIAAADAPVVHVIGEDLPPVPVDGRRPEYVPFAKLGGEAVEVRTVDGVYFVRRMPAEELPEAVRRGDWSNPFNGFYRREDGDYVTAGTDSDSEPVAYDRAGFEAAVGIHMRKWDDRRHDTVASLMARASDMLIVEGWLYEKVAEPALTLVDEGDRMVLRLSEAVREDQRFSKGRDCHSVSNCVRFGIDEFPRALSEGERIASDRGVAFRNRVEVRSHSPWHVRFRGEQEVLYARAWAFMNAASGLLAAADPLFGKAWHDLATALYEHDRISLSAIDAMRRLTAMSDRFSEGLPAEGFGVRSTVAWHGGDGEHRPGTVRARLRNMEDALCMWDTRDGQGIEWLEAGLAATATYEGDARAYEVTDLMEADRISRLFGSDLGAMAQAASAGDGCMVAVEDQGAVRAVFLFGKEGETPEVTETATGHGGAPSRGHLDLAVAHVSAARANDFRVEDAGLEAFGI